MYMHHNHIHCKDTTQSLLIYTKQQQRLYAYVATNIWHSHSYCKDMTQLLRIYTLMQHSKSIDFQFSDQFTCIANTYIAKTWHNLCSYTQNNSNVFAHMLQLIYITHIYIVKTWLSFCTSTDLRDAANQLIFPIFKSIYTHCNYIHCKDTTQSLLIYTEWQQRLCAHAATHIHHTYIHYKDTTQLLRIYTLVWCSKSIDFSIFWSIYMRCKYINQSLFSSFSWMIIQRTRKLTLKWSAFIYINQSSSSSLDYSSQYFKLTTAIYQSIWYIKSNNKL